MLSRSIAVMLALKKLAKQNKATSQRRNKAACHRSSNCPPALLFTTNAA